MPDQELNNNILDVGAILGASSSLSQTVNTPLPRSQALIQQSVEALMAQTRQLGVTPTMSQLQLILMYPQLLQSMAQARTYTVPVTTVGSVESILAQTAPIDILGQAPLLPVGTGETYPRTERLTETITGAAFGAARAYMPAAFAWSFIGPMLRGLNIPVLRQAVSLTNLAMAPGVALWDTLFRLPVLKASMGAAPTGAFTQAVERIAGRTWAELGTGAAFRAGTRYIFSAPTITEALLRFEESGFLGAGLFRGLGGILGRGAVSTGLRITAGLATTMAAFEAIYAATTLPAEWLTEGGLQARRMHRLVNELVRAPWEERTRLAADIVADIYRDIERSGRLRLEYGFTREQIAAQREAAFGIAAAWQPQLLGRTNVRELYTTTNEIVTALRSLARSVRTVSSDLAQAIAFRLGPQMQMLPAGARAAVFQGIMQGIGTVAETYGLPAMRVAENVLANAPAYQAAGIMPGFAELWAARAPLYAPTLMQGQMVAQGLPMLVANPLTNLYAWQLVSGRGPRGLSAFTPVGGPMTPMQAIQFMTRSGGLVSAAGPQALMGYYGQTLGQVARTMGLEATPEVYQGLLMAMGITDPMMARSLAQGMLWGPAFEAQAAYQARVRAEVDVYNRTWGRRLLLGALTRVLGRDKGELVFEILPFAQSRAWLAGAGIYEEFRTGFHRLGVRFREMLGLAPPAEELFVDTEEFMRTLAEQDLSQVKRHGQIINRITQEFETRIQTKMKDLSPIDRGLAEAIANEMKTGLTFDVAFDKVMLREKGFTLKGERREQAKRTLGGYVSILSSNADKETITREYLQTQYNRIYAFNPETQRLMREAINRPGVSKAASKAVSDFINRLRAGDKRAQDLAQQIYKWGRGDVGITAELLAVFQRELGLESVTETRAALESLRMIIPYTEKERLKVETGLEASKEEVRRAATELHKYIQVQGIEAVESGKEADYLKKLESLGKGIGFKDISEVYSAVTKSGELIDSVKTILLQLKAGGKSTAIPVSLVI